VHSLVACQGIALQHQPLRDALFQIDRNCSTPNLNTWHVQSKGGEPDFDSTVSINTTRPATSKTGHPFYSILRHLGLFFPPSEQGFHGLRNHQTPCWPGFRDVSRIGDQQPWSNQSRMTGQGIYYDRF
jgi:hypothetical protein